MQCTPSHLTQLLAVPLASLGREVSCKRIHLASLALEGVADSRNARLLERLVHLDELPDAQGALRARLKGLDGLGTPVSAWLRLKEAHLHLDVLMEVFHGSV